MFSSKVNKFAYASVFVCLFWGGWGVGGKQLDKDCLAQTKTQGIVVITTDTFKIE